jgi:hypothetical protein
MSDTFRKDQEPRRKLEAYRQEGPVRALYGWRLTRALALLKDPTLDTFQRKLADKMANSSFQALDQLGFKSDADKIRESSQNSKS